MKKASRSVVRRIGMVLCAALILCLLAGCAAKQPSPFTAQNEIETYTKIDPEKTQLSVSSLGNNARISALAAAFEKLNPDVQVICVDLTNGDVKYRPVADWVTHGVAPDVMFVNPDTFTDGEWIMEHFEDLSANPVIENFEAQALNRAAVNGFVYFLPAPSEINCIIYNKTLFERYNWEVPASFDDFVALCLQIREDTGGTVQPWNPNAKYDNVFSTAIEAFTYGELLGGNENRSWYNDFCRGDARFAEHMAPLYALLQTLIDNDILLEEHFSYSATARGEEFLAGQIAMYNSPLSKMASNLYSFGYMPYPATNGKPGYVSDFFSSMLCAPQKERSDAQRDAMNRFIAFFGSVQGQQALIGESLMVSNVKNVPLNDAEAMTGIEEVIAQGHTFTRLDFAPVNKDADVSGDEATAGQAYKRSWSLRDGALAMVTGEKTAAEIIAAIDEKPYLSAEEAGVASAVKLAEASSDFTVLEFSFYIADMYREAADSQIALINNRSAYNGNLVRLFRGDIYDSYITPIKPRSFANGSTLVKVSMTGQQLLDALNHPLQYNKNIIDTVYAYSGLKCEIAPWNALGSKYLSVKLADGAEIEPDKLYSVAIWSGSVQEEYITEVLERYEGSWEALMTAKLQADGTIAPADDGRIKLVWS